MTDEERRQRSRVITRWLRHHPEEAGLEIDRSGWTGIQAVLDALEARELPTSRDDLVRLSVLDDKPRIEIEGDRVRARYGHTIALEQAPLAGSPPAVLYHATSRRLMPTLLAKGIAARGKVPYVSLARDLQAARLAGLKHDVEPVIIQVSAALASEAGVRFYPRGRDIWISDPIPPRFVSVREVMSAQTAAKLKASGPRAEVRRRRPTGGFLKKDERRKP